MPRLHLIMPVHSDPNAMEKQAIIRDTVQRAGWDVWLPDYSPTAPSFDIGVALAELRSADLVCADLSGERPSCYYELGLAEALARPVCLVAQRGTRLHQTAHRGRIRYFSNLAEYRASLNSLLSHHANKLAGRRTEMLR